MIIAHVLSSFGLGGQERVVLSLAREQRKSGGRVVVIGLGPGPLESQLRAENATTLVIEKRARLDPSLPFRVARELSRARADVVHTHNPAALVYGASAARLAKIPVLHTKHGLNPDPSRRRALRRAAASLVDAYVAVTPLLADEAARRNECDPTRLHVVENGIDTELFHSDPDARRAIREVLDLDPIAPVVGSVGRLSPEKNQRLLLDAVAREPSWHVVLVGDGPEREALEAHARGLSSARQFHFVGSRDDVERWISAFDVFALPSLTEGLPLSVLEAMASELPVVATRVGGLPDVVVENETGLLVPSGSTDALHAALGTLLRDPERARSMGLRGREHVVQRHSARRMAERYARLYTDVVQRRRLAMAGLVQGAWSP
jgi:glycosyltransferase involved in cell wall biosynthesis